MSVAEIFVARSRYWLTKEYPIKLRHCVNALPTELVWTRSAPGCNSVGNLLVHLSGNVTEWILGGVGNQTIQRFRAGEFQRDAGPDALKLLDDLEIVLSKADKVLAKLTERDLEREIVIQDRETTVLSAVYHVVEHFAMHTGQIVQITKQCAPGTIKFYEDAGGLARPLWHKGTSLDEAPH
jgi:uncharacterized damage-inducible protein DinB